MSSADRASLSEVARLTEQAQRHELHRLTELERWNSLQRYVPCGGLLVGTVLTMAVRDPDWPARWVDLLVVAVALVWVHLAEPQFGRRPVRGPVFFAGWTALAAGLVLCSPWNGFVAFAG